MNKADMTANLIKNRMGGGESRPQDAFETGQDDSLLAQLKALKGQSKPQALAMMSSQEIRVGAFVWKTTGIQVDGPVNREDWEECGKLLKLLDSSMQWLIGDLICCGEDLRWGDQQTIAEQFGFEYGTIRNYAYVARNVDLSIRSDKLDFGHHQLIAPLPAEEQAHWLNLAINGDDGKRWSIARLRAEIQKANSPELAEKSAPPIVVKWNQQQARLRNDMKTRFQKAKDSSSRQSIIEAAKLQLKAFQALIQELEEQS